MVETTGCNGLVKLLRGLQLGAGVFVPEAEAAIWAHGGQSAVDRMEGDGVNLLEENGNRRVLAVRQRDVRNQTLPWFFSINVLLQIGLKPRSLQSRSSYSVDVLWSGCIGSIGPVALEGEVVFGSVGDNTFMSDRKKVKHSVIKKNTTMTAEVSVVRNRRHSRVWGVNVMDSNSSLNASQCKACRLVLFVLEYSNTAVLQTKMRRVINKEDTGKKGNVFRWKLKGGSVYLVFKRRVYSAEFRGLVLQLVNDQAPLSCCNHCHGVHLQSKKGPQIYTRRKTSRRWGLGYMLLLLSYDICAVRSLRHLQRHHWIGWAGVPELERKIRQRHFFIKRKKGYAQMCWPLYFYLQCFVPTSSHDTAVVGGFDPVDWFDWTIMLWKKPKTT